MNPEAVVQRQLDAYNAHDLERFLAEYDDEIRAFRLPSTVPVLDGKAAFGRFYATQRFNLPHLHAILVNRMVLADKAQPWTFGAGDLMRNLAKRGLLA